MVVILVILIIAFICGITTSNMMSSKGRSSWGGFLLGFFFPLVGIIIAALISPDSQAITEREITSGELKKCPYCAEYIKREANVCRYCQKELPIQKGELLFSGNRFKITERAVFIEDTRFSFDEITGFWVDESEGGYFVKLKIFRGGTRTIAHFQERCEAEEVLAILKKAKAECKSSGIAGRWQDVV